MIRKPGRDGHDLAPIPEQALVDARGGEARAPREPPGQSEEERFLAVAAAVLERHVGVFRRLAS